MWRIAPSLVGALVVGCSFESPSSTRPATPSRGSTTAGDDANADTTMASTSGLASETTSETGQDLSPTTGQAGDDTTGSPPSGSRCPDALPGAWILCEDFEDIEDPTSHFAVFTDDVSLDGDGRQSATALTLTHPALQRWSGTAMIRFGEGPGATSVVAPTRRFDDVWTRFYLRRDADWPNSTLGPGDVFSIDGITGSEWALTFTARLSAPQDGARLLSSVRSCVWNDAHPCPGGSEDWSIMDVRATQAGSAPVFRGDPSTWTCVVTHTRLNTPGADNGVFETWVDGRPDSQLSNLDFRGNRADFVFNRLAFSTFMEEPVRTTTRRYIDDLVVSTEPLSCD